MNFAITKLPKSEAEIEAAIPFLGFYPRDWRKFYKGYHRSMKKHTATIYHFEVILDPNGEGYTVTVPKLPGLVTEGSSLAEAREMAKDAIRCHMEGILKEKTMMTFPKTRATRERIKVAAWLDGSMPKLPRIPSLLVIRALKRARFYAFHQSGSHIQFHHLDHPHLRVTVPFHRRDITPKTLRSIIKQSGMTVDEFLELL